MKTEEKDGEEEEEKEEEEAHKEEEDNESLPHTQESFSLPR